MLMTVPIYSAMEQLLEGVLLPNYPEENVVKGENVPNFKFGTSAGTSTGTLSNVFQILQDLWLKQYQETSSDSSKSRMS